MMAKLAGWNLEELPPLFLEGDLNQDGKVNIFDLVIVGSHFGLTSSDSNWDERADANNDGKIDIFDLVIVGRNFGKEK